MSRDFLALHSGSNRGAPVTDANPVPVKIAAGEGPTGLALEETQLDVKTAVQAMAAQIELDEPTVVTGEVPLWTYIPASATDTTAGNANDALVCLLVIPANKSPGAVSFEDGAGTNITLFAGGTDSVSTLIPFPIDMCGIAAGSVWEITTGASVAVVAFYKPRA